MKNKNSLRKLIMRVPKNKRKIVRPQKKKVIQEREDGASLPEDLRKMYQEHLYQQSESRLSRRTESMRETRELLNQQNETLRERLKVYNAQDLEKAKENVERIQENIIENQIVEILKEQGSQIGKITVLGKNTGRVKVSYLNLEGKLEERIFKVDELLQKAKKENEKER